MDEVTWEPAIGGIGPDRYDIPNPDISRILAGDASGFDDVPSIAQLNESSDINQIIGYIRRRYLPLLNFGAALVEVTNSTPVTVLFNTLYVRNPGDGILDEAVAGRFTGSFFPTLGGVPSQISVSDLVIIKGVAGTTSANGTFIASAVVSDDEFTTIGADNFVMRRTHVSLADADSGDPIAGNGAYTSGGMIAKVHDSASRLPEYAVAGRTRITIAFMQNLQGAINAVRAAEGFPAYTFTDVSLPENRRVSGSHVGELRAALALTGALTRTFAVTNAGAGSRVLSSDNFGVMFSEYVRWDRNYDDPGFLRFEQLEGTFNSISDWPAYLGKASDIPFRNSPATKSMARQREAIAFHIPGWLPVVGLTSATFAFTVDAAVTTMEGFTMALYRGSLGLFDDRILLDPEYAGTLYNFVTLENSAAGGSTGPFSFDLDMSNLLAEAGTREYFILGTDEEFSGGGGTEEGANAGKAAAFRLGAGTNVVVTMVLA